jgi:hypothetical protein
MKKQILLVIMVAFVLTSVAQTEKGNRLIGVSLGGFGYSHAGTHGTNTANAYTTQNDNNSYDISINPDIAWFVKDNLAVGGSVNIKLGTDKSKAENNNTINNSATYTINKSSFYIGPYVRYYFAGSKKGQPFAQIAVQYGFGSSKTEPSQGLNLNKTKIVYDYNAGISLGYELFFNKTIGLFASIAFNYGKQKITGQFPNLGDVKSIIETTSFNIPVNLGLQVHLPGKKKK